MYNKERKTKYAIRKLAVATVSLAIGSVVAVPAIVDSGQVAHAEEQGGAQAEKKYTIKYFYNTNGGRTSENNYVFPVEAINKFQPQDNTKYATGEIVKPKLPTQTTYVDTERDGVWNFVGYNEESKTVNGADVQFMGIWEFTPNAPIEKYESSVTFVSVTPGKELPDGIQTFRQAPRMYSKNTLTYMEWPRQTLYKAEDGYWFYIGQSAKTVHKDKLGHDIVKQKSDVEFTGHWKFVKNEEINGHVPGRDKELGLEQLYLLGHRPISDTEGYDIPQAIKDMYPSDLKAYLKSRSDLRGINAEIIHSGIYKSPTGTWSIKEIGSEGMLYYGSAEGIDKDGWNYYYQLQTFVYRWVFTPNNPSYKFVSGTTGKTLPQAITDLTPTDTNTYKKDDVVKAKAPGQITYEDTVNNGTWTFKGYNKNKAIFGVDELKFEGTWEFKPKSPIPTIADNTNPNVPAVTKVDNPAQLTQDEKDKVVDEVKKANPSLPAGTTVTVDNNGDVTITYPDTSTDTIPGVATVEERETSAKPTVDKVDTDDLKVTGTGVAGSKIVVTLPNGDTKTTTVKPDGKWEVDLDNPLAKDGVVKVTQEETDKKVSPIAPTTVVPTTAEATTPNNPAVTKVDNPTQLTQDEKDKVVDKVKKANPGLPGGTTVTVDDNGDVTITYPDKSKDTIPGASTVAEKETSAKPTVDKVDTDDTKITGTGVAGSKIVVTLPNGDTKTTTVKPDGKWEVDLDNPLAKDGVVKVTQEETDKKVSPIAPTTVVPTTADKTTPNVPAVTEVENKTQLTQEEKGKVEKAVKDANPTFPAGTTVTVDNNGEVTITYPDKSKDTIPGTSTVVEKATTPKIADTTTPKLPEVTEVEDPTQLTQDEKDKVVDKVKKANPGLPAGTTVTVGNNGDVTITYPDKSKNTIPGIHTVVKKGHSPAPVVDKVDTDDTKITGEGVVGATVEVELPDGTKKTTVVKPDGKWEVPLANPLPKDSVVKVTQTAPGKKVSEKVPAKVVETIADKTTPNVPAVTEVENKTQLTQEEKGKVEKAVKDANPTFPAGTTVTVDNNGEVTITYPDKSKDTIPGTSTVVEKATTPKIADTTTPKLPEVTEVEDPTQLTQDEKDKVVDKVKKANPGLPAGTTVTVGNNGDVTITYPDKSKNTIPGIHTVVKKGHSPAPVVDKVDTDDTKITGEGVVGATVEVELPDGTKKTTVVKPDGKWEVPLANPLPKGSVVKATQTAPGKKVSEKVPTTVVSIADNTNPNVPTVTEVENKTKLTQGEKDKVVDEVKKANPGLPAGTTITVADNGDVTITYPDNSIDIIPGTKTVTEKTKVPGPAPKPTPQPQPGQKTIAEQITPKTPEVTEVGNKTKLTQGEKGKVEEAVKKANPGLPAGTKITVADNGEVTITYPDGSVDTIPGESTVKEKVKPAGEKAKAKTLPNTGLTANNAVVAGLSILAMAALLAARRKNNK